MIFGLPKWAVGAGLAFAAWKLYEKRDEIAYRRKRNIIVKMETDDSLSKDERKAARMTRIKMDTATALRRMAEAHGVPIP